MKIDRALFLLLTGTLAATACATAPASKPPYTSSDPDPAFQAMKPSTVAAAPTAAPPPTPSAEGGLGLSLPPTPPPPPKRDPKTIANNSEDDDACGHTKKRNSPNKTGNDAAGAPINCKAVAFGYAAKEGCQGPDDLVGLCDGYKRILKPRLASQAFACMARMPVARKCSGCDAQTCGYDALMDAVPDATADADCNEIGNRCEAFDTSRCKAFLSGMTAQGRLAMKACMMSDCRTGLFACARGATGND